MLEFVRVLLLAEYWHIYRKQTVELQQMVCRPFFSLGHSNPFFPSDAHYCHC